MHSPTMQLLYVAMLSMASSVLQVAAKPVAGVEDIASSAVDASSAAAQAPRPEKIYSLTCAKNDLSLTDIKACRDFLRAAGGPYIVSKTYHTPAVKLCHKGNVYISGTAVKDNNVALSYNDQLIETLDSIVDGCGAAGGANSYPDKARYPLNNFVLHIGSHWVPDVV